MPFIPKTTIDADNRATPASAVPWPGGNGTVYLFHPGGIGGLYRRVQLEMSPDGISHWVPVKTSGRVDEAADFQSDETVVNFVLGGGVYLRIRDAGDDPLPHPGQVMLSEPW